MDTNYKYEIKLDIKKDAWNWYEACNRISHGMDWKQRVPVEISDKIYNKTEKEAYDFLMPFLKQKYIDDKQQIDEYIKYMEEEYEQKFVKACNRLVDLLGRPLYRNNFAVFLTTFPRGPYNYESGYIWKMIKRKGAIDNLLHELSHFQFIHYWRNNPDSKVSKLSNEQFEWFKESLTVILDEDLLSLIETPDAGYPIHQEFRKELHEFWKTNKNFDELVEFGLEKLPEFVK